MAETTRIHSLPGSDYDEIEVSYHPKDDTVGLYWFHPSAGDIGDDIYFWLTSQQMKSLIEFIDRFLVEDVKVIREDFLSGI